MHQWKRWGKVIAIGLSLIPACGGDEKSDDGHGSGGRRGSDAGTGGRRGGSGGAGTDGGKDCGNGQIDGDELCDGEDLGGETCESATVGAMLGGQLRCSAACTFDTSGCGSSSGGAPNGDSGVGARGGLDGGGGFSGLCRSSHDCRALDSARPICDYHGDECLDCQQDSDCYGRGLLCRNNQCLADQECENSLGCAGRQDGRTICAVGFCVECGNTDDCEDAEVCRNYACAPACDSDNDCTPQGLLCNVSAGACVQCLRSQDCAEKEYCLQGKCTPDTCNAGESYCAPQGVVRCAADGSEATVRNCGQQVCVYAFGEPTCGDETCFDGIKDTDETDVDCGGNNDCARCPEGGACRVDQDCWTTLGYRCIGCPDGAGSDEPCGTCQVP